MYSDRSTQAVNARRTLNEGVYRSQRNTVSELGSGTSPAIMGSHTRGRIVSGSIRFMRGFAGEGASNESGVVENGDFRFIRSQSSEHHHHHHQFI